MSIQMAAIVSSFRCVCVSLCCICVHMEPCIPGLQREEGYMFVSIATDNLLSRWGDDSFW